MSTAETTTAPDASRPARFALRFAVAGLVAALVGPVLESLGSTWDGVPTGMPWLFGVGLVVQAASVALLLGGVVVGIIALARRARPVTRPVLAIVALPVTGVLVMIEIFVLFLIAD
jgi:hypothetical protein